MRLGLIGCGRWGRNIMSTARDLLDAKLVAVASANSGTACMIPENCCVFPDWRSLLDSNLIDGVIIASPAYTHAEIALAAMERHIPVLIEKPMALSIDDAEALLKSSIKNQTYATVDHIHLFNPAFRRMVEIMPKYGSILNISGVAGGPGPYRSDCSALWDWAPHDISMILTLTKLFPIKVLSQKIPLQPDAPDNAEHVFLKLIFEKDITASIDISNHRDIKTRILKVTTTHGTLEYDDTAEIKLRSSSSDLDVSYNPNSPLLTVLNEFVDNISKSSNDISGLKLGLDIIRILDQTQRTIDGF